MRKFCRALAAFLAGTFAIPAFARTWTDCTGLHKTEAEVAYVTDEDVGLKKADGTVSNVPFDKLSAVDIAYLTEYVRHHRPPNGPPELLKSDIDKAADEINGLIKRLHTRLAAAFEENTTIRLNVAYLNIMTDLDKQLAARPRLAIRFPIKDVDNNSLHTLTLDGPEDIEGIENHLVTFNTRYPTDKAVQINQGDALVIRGKGRLFYSTDQTRLPQMMPPKTELVIIIYDKTSKLHYGLALQDYAFQVEHEITTNVPKPPAQPAAVPATPQAVVQPATPQPIQPAPAQANFAPAPNAPPQPAAKPFNLDFFTTAPATPAPVTPSPAVIAPPISPPAQPAFKQYRPPEQFDLYLPSAKNIAASLTPEKHDQRNQRMRATFPRYEVYAKMPDVDIGGNLNPIFWYAIQDWDAQRRALWLYHYRDIIDPVLYAPACRDPNLVSELAKLESQHVTRNPYYLDPDFESDADLMYREEFVDAVYNRGFNHVSDWEMPWATLVGVVIFGTLVLVSWSKYEGWI